MKKQHWFDPSTINLKELGKRLKALKQEVVKDVGEEDIKHLQKVERIGKLSTIFGFGTAWIFPNPVSAYLISQGLLTRWGLMHHISHRGYDKVPGIPKKYTSKVFGRGPRRLFDWMDWILPEAWHEEHDFLHHFRLGEDGDPDLIERNSQKLRKPNIPIWLRYLAVGGLAATWKWFYYSPNTFDKLQRAEARRDNLPEPEDMELLNPFNERGRELYLRALLPHLAWRFFLLPALFLPLGPVAVFNVSVNTILAEIITNIHAFIIIGPNHSGDDLYRFDEPVTSREEFYLRQIIGSTNYKTGSEVIDYLQMWLNYQIEHHLWPDLTMLQYRKIQPKVKELCEEMGIPYVEENVFRRVKRMVDIIVGHTQMRSLKNAVESPFKVEVELQPEPV